MMHDLHITEGCVVWLTGFSASGKSTIAAALAERLTEAGVASARLDGDVLRRSLCSDLGFTQRDRNENIRRAAEVASMMEAAGLVVLASFISPYATDRTFARSRCMRFLEVFVDTPLDVCEARDPKGLYKQARAGSIKMFTGVSAPYEVPKEADVVVNGDILTADEAAGSIFDTLTNHGWL